MTTSDIIASIALLVTIIGQIRSEYKSKKNDSEQRLMRDEQDRLRKLLLEKETK